MKLHEMKQKRNTIAKDMRALHDKIGDTPGPMNSVLSGTLQNRSLTPLMSVLHAKRNCAARIRTISTKTSRNSASSRIVIQQTRKHRLTNAVLRRLMRFCAVVLAR